MMYYEQYLFAGKVHTEIKKKYIVDEMGEKVPVIDFRILKVNGKKENGEWLKATFINAKGYGSLARWVIRNIKKGDNIIITAHYRDGAWQREDGTWAVFPHFVIKYCKLISGGSERDFEYTQSEEELNKIDDKISDLKNNDIPF